MRGAMGRQSRYHSEFDSDVIEAAEWYERSSRELALDFVDRVEEAVSKILSDPHRRSPIDFGLRYWPLKRFPHIVFYDITETEILLIGVMHPARRPDKWIDRSG